VKAEVDKLDVITAAQASRIIPPRGSVTRQGVVLAYLPTFSHLLIVNKLLSPSLPLSLSLTCVRLIVDIFSVMAKRGCSGKATFQEFKPPDPNKPSLSRSLSLSSHVCLRY
jgi:hypothetical protein